MTNTHLLSIWVVNIQFDTCVVVIICLNKYQFLPCNEWWKIFLHAPDPPLLTFCMESPQKRGCQLSCEFQENNSAKEPCMTLHSCNLLCLFGLIVGIPCMSQGLTDCQKKQFHCLPKLGRERQLQQQLYCKWDSKWHNHIKDRLDFKQSEQQSQQDLQIKYGWKDWQGCLLAWCMQYFWNHLKTNQPSAGDEGTCQKVA